MKKKNLVIYFIQIVFFICIFSDPANGRTIEKILAIVNDDIITLTDLESYRQKLQSGALLDEAILRTIENPKNLFNNRQDLINHLVDELIVDLEVKKHGLEVPMEKVEQEIRSITRRNGLSRENLKTALKEKGVSFSEYQNFIRTTLERQSLIEKEITSKIKISDDEISSYYLAHTGDKNANVFEYTLAHILILPNKNSNQSINKANLVYNKLKSNPSLFDQLAAEFSEDPGFAQGGVLGTFKAGEMLPEMEKAVKNLSVGEFTDVIKTKAGWHIVKVLKKTLVPHPGFESKKEEIRQLLLNQAFKRQLRQWLDNKHNEFFIRINSV